MAVDSAPVAVAVGQDEISRISDPSTARRRLHGLSITVFVVGILASAGLATASHLNYTHNERRQVSTQTQIVAAALSSAPVDIQRRIGRATTLAAATGNASLFKGAMKSSLPAPFVTAELFRVANGVPHQVLSMGVTPMLVPASPQAQQLLHRAIAKGSLVVTRVARPSAQRFAYAMAVTAVGRTYVGYAEEKLPASRHLALPASSPLANMIYAIYYGKSQTQAALIETNASRLPIEDQEGVAPVPFGDQVLTAVMTARTPLLGSLAAYMAWLIAAAGALLSLIMAVLTERLQRRRAVAEELAIVSNALYRAERGVAETLQTALLPSHLPRPLGLSVATRYIAGTEGIEIGGDWYDLVSLPDNRLFFTIGDVSGRGLSAATMMSRLRHSITAYAVEGDDPSVVLAKVSRLVDVSRDGHFATALCGVLELDNGVATVANAGHPPLLRISEDTVAPVATPIGPPLGVGGSYTSTHIALTPGTVLLAYTDGLVERRGEPVDESIANLCRVTPTDLPLEILLDTILEKLAPHAESQDDTAILGLKWTP